MATELIWESSGIYRRYHGDVSIQERRQSLEAICADPRFDNLSYTITDYLAVRSYETSHEATMEIASLHVGPLYANPRIVIAAVVTAPRIIEAIEHFISLAMVHAPYRVFASLQEARGWVENVPRRPTVGRVRF